jgi:hypothetical protein
MASTLRYRRKSVYGMVILIILSLLAELLLTYENTQIIEKNNTLWISACCFSITS